MQLQLDRLPGPLRQAPRGEQPPAGFLQRVVPALRHGADVLGPDLLPQRLQHRRQRRRTAGGQVPGDPARAAEGGLQPQPAIREPVITVPVRPGDAAADLLRQLAQSRQVRAGGRRPHPSDGHAALPGCAGPHGRGDPPEPAAGASRGEDRQARAARAERDRRHERSKAAARELILRHAVALLSGPGGLASWLRTGTLPPPAASVSLPLDVGAVTDLVPPYLRRAIITRDRHCAAPGCDTPPQACHVHHIIPRSQGGTTSLANCILLCAFHHLIMIHRWGWTITLNADGTTTATSPHGRTLHSHSPPTAA